MKNLLLFGVLLTLLSPVYGQTYSEDIAPIIYNNCTTCHRAGEIGPMPLTSYEEVSQWAQTIAFVTEVKYMPPWKPDRSYSSFVAEKGLSEAEIQLIQDWVADGTPQGDPANEPPIPDFPSGSQLGTPDLVLQMTESYTVEGNNQDDYRVFVLPTSEIEDKEIAAIEFRPGNTKVVHHALIAFDETGAAANLDAQTPEYGYFSYGDFGIGVPDFSNGYTPGIQTIKYPEGIGEILPAGADLLIQVHYAPVPVPETDQSSVNIFFKKENDPIERPIQTSLILPNTLPNGWNDFFIPANQQKFFHGVFPVNQEISLFQIYPHAHLLCRDWEIFAITPASDTIQLLKIDDWDFNWQGAYTFDRMKRIPAGSRIHILANYDNTSGNPANPNNPPQFVSWGEGTTDEMFVILANWVLYQEGDELIEIGEQLTSTVDLSAADQAKLYSPVPNPATDVVRFNYYLPEAARVDMSVFSIEGKLIKSVLDNENQLPGNHFVMLPVDDLADGTYLIVMDLDGGKVTQKLVVRK